MEEFYGPSTKSNTRMPNVYIINLKTKSNDETLSTSIVNFEENQGFVVLVQDQQTEENLVAISNNGNINTSLLKNALLVSDSLTVVSDTTATLWGGELFEENEEEDDINEPYYDINPTYSSETFTPFITNDQPDYTATTISQEIRFVEYYLADHIRRDGLVEIKDDYISDNGTSTESPQWSSWKFYSGKSPIIKTKWHQNSPYNNSCPIKKGKRAPAGCVAIATGQIAAYFQKPDNENWSVMSSFGVYNVGKGGYNEPIGDYSVVSSYILSLGKELWTSYGANGSGSSIYRAKHYIKKHMGFNDARIHKWDWGRVRNRLNKDIPVYTRGKGPEGGHAWIVDGYIIQYRTDQNHVYPNQYRTLVHVNWGWGHGKYDGYYLLGVFDPTTMPLDYDTSVGDQGKSRSDKVKFTKRIKTLTWSAK